MPLIDPQQFKSVHSYQGPTVPDYNFLNKGFDTIGSKDTVLNRLSGSYYDESFSPYRDQNNQRYQNQNFLSYIGNNAAALGAKTFAVGLPSLVGSLTSLAASPLALSSDVSLSDVFEMNPLNQAAKYIDHTTDALTPRFQASDFNDLSFVEQLKRPGELLSQNIDSLAFLAQSFVGSGLVANLGLGNKLISALAKSKPIYQNALQADRVAQAANVDFFTSLGLLTTNEAALEGGDAKEQVIEKLNRDRMQGLNTYSDEEIDSISKQAFSNTFWLNMLSGSVTNGVFMKMLTPLFSKSLKTRANDLALKASKDGGIEKQVMPGLEGFFFDKGNTFGRVTTNLAEQILSEGTEESIQYSIQQAAMLDSKRTSLFESGSKVLEDIASLEIYNLSDKERQKAFGLGALIGGAGDGISNLIPDGKGATLGAAGQAREFRKSQEDAIEAYNKSYTSLVDNGLAAKETPTQAKVFKDEPSNSFVYEDSTGRTQLSEAEYKDYITKNNLPDTGGEFTTPAKYKLDDKGNVVLDPVAIAKLQIDASVTSTLSEYIEDPQNENNLKKTLFRNELLSDLAVKAFNSGTTDILLEQLDNLKNTPQALLSENTEAEIGYMKDFVKRLETNYLNATNYFIPTSTKPEDVKDLERRKTAYLAKANRIVTLQDLESRLYNEASELRKELIQSHPKNEEFTLQIAKAIDNRSAQDLYSALTYYEGESSDLVKALNEMTDINALEAVKQDSKVLAPYAKKYAEYSDVNEARRDIEATINSILNDKKWKEKKTPELSIYETPMSIVLDKNLTTKGFGNYLKRKVRFTQNKNALANVNGHLTSDVINRIISRAGTNPSLTAEQLTMVLERLVANDITVSEETRDIITKYIWELKYDVTKAAADLAADLTPYYYEEVKPENVHNLDPMDFEFDIYETNLVDRLENYKQLYKASLPLIQDSTLIQLFSDKGTYRMWKDTTEYSLMFQEVESLFKGTQELLSRDRATITEVASIEYELESLNNIGRLLEGLEKEVDVKEGMFDVPRSWVKNYKPLLEQLLQVAKDNVANKALEDATETRYQTEEIINLSTLPEFTSNFSQEEISSLQDVTLEPNAKAAFVLDKLKSSSIPETSLADSAYRIYSDLMKRFPRLGSNPIPREAFDNITHSPNKLFSHILTQIANNAGGKLPELENFAKTFNVTRFLSFPFSPLFTKSEAQSIVNIYLQASALSILKAHQSSPLSARTILSRMHKALSDAKDQALAGRASVFPPSISQERLLRELIILSAQSKIKDPNIFHNVIGIKSPAGAGKSTVMTPIAISVLGYAPEEILTSANKKLAAENIQASVPTTHGIFTASELLELFNNKQIPPSVRLIILDEAGGVDQITLYKLAGAFTKFQLENQDRDVKLWMIYDTNQSGNSQSGNSSLDLGYTPSQFPEYVEAKKAVLSGSATTHQREIVFREEKGQLDMPRGITPFLENLQVVSPITTSYRSNVSSIARAMDAFLTNFEVKQIDSSTSSDISNLKDIQGVFATSLSPDSAIDSIKRIATKSISQNPSRSRIIITHEHRKPLYANLGIIVATPEESAGRSYDEVYIDYDQNSLSLGAYNRDMYTAMSRARDFIFTTSIKGSNEIDPSIPAKAEAEKRSFRADYDSALDKKSRELSHYDILTKKPIATPTPTRAAVEVVSEESPETTPVFETKYEPTDEDIIEESIEKDLLENADDADYPTEDAPAVVDGNISYELSHPKNTAFRYADVKIGDQLNVFKHSSNGLSRVVAVKLFNDQYIEVGMFSDEAISKLPTDLKNRINALSPIETNSFEMDDMTVYNLPASFDSFPLYVSEGSHPMIFDYSGQEYTYDSPSDLEQLLSKFLLDLSRKDPTQFANIDEVLANPYAIQSNGEPYVKAVIYSEVEAKKLNDPVIRPYVPYLKIQGIRTNKGNFMKPLHIEHKAAIVKASGFESLATLTDMVDRFTNLTATHPALKGTIYEGISPETAIRMSDVDPLDTRNVYYPYAAFIAALADAKLTNRDTIKVASEGLVHKLKLKAPHLAPIDLKTSDVKDLLDLADSIDFRIHGDSINEDGIPARKSNGGRIRKYRGDAQKQFNRLATSNFMTEFEDGSVVVLRNYELSPTGDKSEAVAMPLIGRVKFESESGASINPKIAPELIEKFRTKYESLKRRGLEDSNFGIKIKQTLEAIDANGDVHIKPLGLKDLVNLRRALFEPNKVSREFGLRQPLSFSTYSATRNQINEEGSSILEDGEILGKLSTKFKQVIPTQLNLSPIPTSGEITYPETPASSTDKDKVSKLVSEGKTLEEIQSLGYAFEGIEEFVTNLQKDIFYTTRSRLILSELRRAMKLPSLQERFNYVFENSDSILEPDKKGLKKAPRDYIRAFILAEAFQLTSDQAIQYARKFWLQDKDEYNAFDDQLSDEFALMMSPDRVNYIDDLVKVFEKEDPSLKKSSDPLKQLNYLVISARKLIKEGKRVELAEAEVNQAALLTNVNLSNYRDSWVKETLSLLNDSEASHLYELALEDESYLQAFLDRIQDLISQNDVAIIRDLKYNINPEELGRDLTFEEARSYYNSLVKPSMVERLRRLFKSKQGRDFQIVSKLQMFNSMGKANWGLFKAGVVYVVENDGKVKSKVVAHEAFHQVVWSYLTPLERIKLFDLAKQKYGSKDPISLEEDLANEFMNYVRKPKSFKGKLYEIFRKILNFFGFTYNNLSSIDAFFDELASGMISGANVYSSEERDLAERWPNVDQYVIARDTFLEAFNKLYSDPSTLTSFEEALEDTFDLLRKFVSGDIQLPFIDPIQHDLVRMSLIPLVDRRTKASQEFVQKYFRTVNVKGAKEVKISQLEGSIKDLEEQLEIAEDDQRALLTSELELTKGLLLNETIESELFDPIDKVNGRIKQRLVRLSYKSQSGIVKGDYYGIYNSILPLVANAPNSSLEDFINHIETTAVKKVGLVREEIPSNVRRAGAKFILETTTKVKELLKSSDKTIVFYKDANYASEYAVVSLTNSSVEGITRTEALSKPTLYKVVPRQYGVRVEDWVRSIKDSPQALDSFRLYEELTFLKALVTSTASLTKANPFVGVSQYRNFEYRNSYAPNRIAGKEAIIESRIKTSILESITSPKPSLFVDPEISSKLSGDLETKKLAIKNFLLAIKTPFSFVDSPSTSLDTINQVASYLSFFKPRLEKAFADFKENEDFEALYDFINDESSTISTLVDAMSQSSSAIELNNFIKADGKKAYLYRESSFQSFLANFLTTGIGKPDHLFFEGGNLKTSAKILSKNKFVNGSKILSHLIHDGLKTKGNERFAVSLTSEKDLHYFDRTFKNGFLSRFRSSSGKSYYQFMPIPSNRTTISAFEIALSRNSDQEIRNIIEAEKNRPAPSEFPLNKQYQKNWNQFRFPGLSGKAEGDTNELLNKVKAHVKENAEKAAEEYIKLNPKLDKRDLDFAVSSLGVKVEGYMSKRELDAKLKVLRTSKKGKDLATIKILNTEIENLKQASAKADLKALYPLMEIFYTNHIVNQYSLSQLLYSDEAFYADKEAQTKRIQSATGSGEIALADKLTGFHKDSQLASNVLVLDDLSATLPDYLEDYRPASYKQEFDETDAQGFITPAMYETISNALGADNAADIVLKPLHYAITDSGEVKLIKFSTTVISDEFIEGIRNLPDGNSRVKFFLDLRAKMEASTVGMAVFQSAFKLGSTNKGAKIINDSINDGPLESSNIVKINPAFTRFQLNPSVEVDVDVANFSQGTSMINTNGLNESEGHLLHTINNHQISLGLTALKLDLTLDELNNPTDKTDMKLRQMILEKAESSPSTSGILELLKYRSKGSHGISLNAPLVHSKLIAMISSAMSSPTVGFRLPGSKLVLQSEVGTYSAASSRLQWKDKDGYTEVLLPEEYKSFFSEGDVVAPGKSIIGFRIPTSNLHSLQVLKVKGFYKSPANSLGNVVIAPREMVYITGNDFDVDSLFLVRKSIFNEADEISFAPYGINYTAKRGDVLGIDNGKVVLQEGKTIAQWLESNAIFNLSKLRQLRELPKSQETTLEIVKLTKKIKDTIRYAKEINNNIIVHTMAGVLLDQKNRYDLNTPITLDRVKRTKGDTKNDLIRSFDDLTKELKKLNVPEEYLDITSFIDKVEQDGFESIISSETELGKRFLSRFDYLTQKESVMEMLASEVSPKEGLWTLREVEQVLYPKGQLTDYLVQKQIHKNTYSGLKITGITANSTKTIAYLFHGASIESIEYEGTVYTADSSETKSLLASKNVRTFEELVAKDLRAKVISKSTPTLKEGKGLRINRGVYNSLSRNERAVVKTESGYSLEDVYEGFRPVNIFETLDTILNLAIDNVKEQKLSFLGITNANSNLYLSAIALGVPLNDVVKMFNTLKLDRYNEDSLDKEIDSVTRSIHSMSVDQLLELTKDLEISGAISERTLGDDISPTNLLNQLSKKGYYSTKADNILNYYLLLQQAKKLSSIGNELFESAQVLSSLRKVPNQKWKIDYLLDRYSKLTSPTNAKRVFANVSLANIPNVVAAMSVLQTTKAVTENSILLHRQPFVKFAEKVMEKTSMANSFAKQEQLEFIQVELVKMLTSDLSISIGDEVFELDIPQMTYTSKSGTVLYGADAFAQKFVEEVRKAIVRYPNNEFLQSLEISYDYRGMGRIDLTAARTGQEEIDIRLKEAFKTLIQDNKSLAVDFVRYEVIKRGLVFGRTSVSSVFPPYLISGITSTLDKRLEKFLSHPDYQNRIFDVFLPQFVRNNAPMLRFLPKDGDRYPDPISMGSFVSTGGSTVKVTSGTSEGIYFDLAFPKSSNASYPYFDIIKRYGDETYRKIAEDSQNVYYRMYSPSNITKYYSFDESFFESSYNEAPLLETSNKVIRNYFLSGNSLFHETGLDIFKPGDLVLLADKGSATPLYYIEATIVSARPSGNKTIYQVRLGNKVPLITKGVSLNTVPNSLLQADNTQEAIALADVTDSVAVVAKPGIKDTIYLGGTLDEMRDVISNLPSRIVLDRSILTSLYNVNRTSAIELASVLESKLGYRDAVLDREEGIDPIKYIKLVKLETSLPVAYTTQGQIIKARLNTSTGPIVKGDIIQLGITSRGTYMFAIVDDIVGVTTKVRVFGPEVFAQLNEDASNFEEVYNKVC